MRGFAVGDDVYARPRDGRIGTLAELIAVPAADVARKPASLSMEDVAAFPLAALTAWQALVERGKLTAGQKVLIHAGSGGVGVVAIQLAKHLGATVATTASSTGADLMRRFGADIVITYKTQDFSTRLTGYELLLASQDAKTPARPVGVLKPGGMLISLSRQPARADRGAGRCRCDHAGDRPPVSLRRCQRGLRLSRYGPHQGQGHRVTGSRVGLHSAIACSCEASSIAW